MVGIRSSGFFAENTIPVGQGDRHVKSTTMGYNRDQGPTPMVKRVLQGSQGLPPRLNTQSKNENYII